MPPATLALDDIRTTLLWYELNLCQTDLRDPRGYRVRFKPEDFVHLIQLKNKHGNEPKNRRLAIEDIKNGKMRFVAGRFDPQRTSELSWASEIVMLPDRICLNWQALGSGDEAYVKNFGTEEAPRFRILVCKVVGQTRHAVTIFPRERISAKDLQAQIWP